MTFPDAFTLYSSPIATVRVEPPDIVIIECPGLEPLRFARSQLRACDPMLVEIYRRGYDATFPPGRDGDIVVRLHIDGNDVGHIGPFAWEAGVQLGETIRRVHRDFLFARPDFSVVFSEDESYVEIDNGHRQIRARASTSRLLALTVCEDPKLDDYHVVQSGLLPRGQPHWVAFEFTRAGPWLLGPFGERTAGTIARVFRDWRGPRAIDVEPVEVTEQALVDEPQRWHLRRIAVTGTWQCALEVSRFANAWLQPAREAHYGTGTYRARVVGTWVCPREVRGVGYGHMGAWPAELRAETIEILAVSDRGPGTDRDGLTGLLNRRALEAAFPPVRTESEACGGSISVALINLDELRRFNAAHGHAAGDELLKRCARAIETTARPGDTIARWRGDEFAVVMPGTAIDAACVLVERMREAVRGQMAGITCSAGVAQVRRGETLGEVAHRADFALYQAKQAGRDRLLTARDA